MRILSQNAPFIDVFDIPYEMTILSMSKYMEGRFRVYAQGTFIGNTCDNNSILIAEYKTEEKARKALDMLHEKYREVTIYPFSDKSSTIPPKVFQFPSDSEIEV